MERYSFDSGDVTSSSNVIRQRSSFREYKRINIDILRQQLHVDRVKQGIVEETVDRRLEKERWKRDFITGNDRYIYYMARWRRIYVKTDNGYSVDLTDTDSWYIRTGRGGTEYVKLRFNTLISLQHRSVGDERITYEALRADLPQTEALRSDRKLLDL